MNMNVIILSFTIQNVPIKLLSTTMIAKDYGNLQYKMFLLNNK